MKYGFRPDGRLNVFLSAEPINGGIDRGGARFTGSRDPGFCRECNQLVAPAVEERAGSNQKSAGLGLSQAVESVVDLAFVIGPQNLNRQSDHLCRLFESVWKRTAAGQSELISTATIFACGTRSRKSPSRFAASPPENIVTPVAFPPGFARLVTKPSRTGSSPLKNVIGIVVVAAMAEAIEGLFATITAT